MDQAILRPSEIGGAGRAFLRCSIEMASGIIVLHAEGEVDMATAPALEEAIRAAYQAGPRVIVDLGGLRHIDGSGIHVLEEISRANATRFAVMGAPRDIHRLLKILGLADSLPVVPSLDAAHEYFGRY